MSGSPALHDASLPSTNPMSLVGRTVLVTGASAGIGRDTARLLAELGARTVLVARRRDRLDELAAELPGSGHRVAEFDLGDAEAIPGWMKRLAGDGPLHGLVHCAGIQATLPVRAMSMAQFEGILRINLTAAVALAKGFRQPGVAAGPGSLVFISSVMGIVAKPALVAYAASKGGLQSAVRVLALEFAREGHRVNCVAPAHVPSEMAAAVEERWTEEQLAEVRRLHPLGTGQTRDVANAIAFLLADSGRWITGTTLVVDGGYTAQ